MDTARLARPRVPTWWIFDEARFTVATLVPTYMGPTGPVRDYAWSRDNGAEMEQTVARYNEHCAEGADADFGRDPGTLTPPSGSQTLEA
jgi:hypothetical protein